MQCLEFPITFTLQEGILKIFLCERFRNLARWTGQNPLHTNHPLSKFWRKVGACEMWIPRQTLLSPYIYISVWANTQYYSIRPEQNGINCITLRPDWVLDPIKFQFLDDLWWGARNEVNGHGGHWRPSCPDQHPLLPSLWSSKTRVGTHYITTQYSHGTRTNGQL